MNHLTNLYKHKCEQLQEQINNMKKMLNEMQLPPGVIGTDQHGPPSPGTPIFPVPLPLPGNPFDDGVRNPKPGATPEQMSLGMFLTDIDKDILQVVMEDNPFLVNHQ